ARAGGAGGGERGGDRVERGRLMAPGVHTAAVVGVGKIGELLLAGLLRAGWPADKLLGTARRPERAEELAQRYGVAMVDNLTAVARAEIGRASCRERVWS